MSTWIAVIAATAGRTDFWSVARQHDIVAADPAVPPHVLIDVGGSDPMRAITVARALSAATGSDALGFAAQTVADVYLLHAFRAGELVRRLEYVFDAGGWQVDEGATQSWEAALFFDPSLDDEVAFEDEFAIDVDPAEIEAARARYREARRVNDPRPIIDLIHPSSTEPLHRICASFAIDPSVPPAGRWHRWSRWARLLGR